MTRKVALWFVTGLVSTALAVTLMMATSAAPLDSIGEASVQTTTNHVLQPIGDPTQQQALRDGLVSHEEMRQALLRMVDCIRSAGYESELLTFVPRLRYEIDVSSLSASVKDQEAQDQVYNDCETKYLSLILDAYTTQHRLSEAELEARNEQLLDCVSNRSGVAVDGRSLEEMWDAVGPAGGQFFEACDDEIGVPID